MLNNVQAKKWNSNRYSGTRTDEAEQTNTHFFLQTPIAWNCAASTRLHTIVAPCIEKSEIPGVDMLFVLQCSLSQ